MLDFTRTPAHRLRLRPALILAAVTVLLALGSVLAGSARADGDPASDVLATQPLYLPPDAGVPAGQQVQLGALLDAARRSGYPIRVAMIASSADLGSITELWRQPENYARFLDQELSLVYPGPLLVVMPNGYGVAGFGGALGADQVALAGVSRPGARLGTATLIAVQRLAAASGYRLALPRETNPLATSSAAALGWIVFGIGSALIILAWAGSLRARPLGVGKGPSAAPNAMTPSR